MNTIVALTLIAWTATCLAVIHHRHLRRAIHSALCHVVRFARTRKAKSNDAR